MRSTPAQLGSSCECKKVVSDNLGEIAFFFGIKYIGKNIMVSYSASPKWKYLHFYERN